MALNLTFFSKIVRNNIYFRTLAIAIRVLDSSFFVVSIFCRRARLVYTSFHFFGRARIQDRVSTINWASRTGVRHSIGTKKCLGLLK